ncbi:Gfo/Idh/MocA family oxidoreductase [Pseudogracilibacillus sp. SE30717A]|uniref:Gfo/Idh/MocA family protein n=1 Tax=Pseudogracilibacillus sp. SE30717A TaxID=3098293 RepID=UPI00300E049D
MKEVRLAVLGLNHGYKFAKDIIELEGVELVAVAGQDILAKERAAAMNVPLFVDYRELLATCDIDGAIITLPNQLHLEAVRECARRGIDVLVEKPIAATVEEGDEIVRIAQEAGIKLLVGHHRRFSNNIMRLREVILSGAIGDLIGVNMLFTLAKDHDYFKESWRVSTGGGGPLLINAAHDIDNLRFVTGRDIERVYASSQNRIRSNEVEDAASVLLEMKDGPTVNYFITDGVPAPWSYEFTTGENPKYPHYGEENCYYFFGTKGSIAFPSMKMYTYEGEKYGWDHPLSEEILGVVDNDPMTTELHHFIDVINQKASPLVSGEDALETLKVVLAIKQSAETKQLIDL